MILSGLTPGTIFPAITILLCRKRNTENELDWGGFESKTFNPSESLPASAKRNAWVVCEVKCTVQLLQRHANGRLYWLSYQLTEILWPPKRKRAKGKVRPKQQGEWLYHCHSVACHCCIRSYKTLPKESGITISAVSWYIQILPAYKDSSPYLRLNGAKNVIMELQVTQHLVKNHPLLCSTSVLGQNIP